MVTDNRGEDWGSGYGTLEELLEVITYAQLAIHDKAVGMLNVDWYYNSLLSARHIILSVPTAHELLSKLEEYVPKHHGHA
ncbi:hypothetical protein MLD38_010985 [Melastoma candidum]|uniref:Uncharacterized protein n=1 Tax=Melastoma candidum TaxID=119954 RepID=A0ACB9R135_9MYRT|nr:hypothetical protein MLD38_010985 [Melastoma candidum]